MGEPGGTRAELGGSGIPEELNGGLLPTARRGPHVVGPGTAQGARARWAACRGERWEMSARGRGGPRGEPAGRRRGLPTVHNTLVRRPGAQDMAQPRPSCRA